MSIYVVNEDTRALPKIGIVELDANINENHQFSNVVPMHKTEAGFSVSDSIISNAMKLSITCKISTTALNPNARNTSLSRVDSAYVNMKKLVEGKALMSVVTGLTTYTNMAITSLSIPRSGDDGASLTFNVDFIKVRIARSLVTIDDKKGGAVIVAQRSITPLYLYYHPDTPNQTPVVSSSANYSTIPVLPIVIDNTAVDIPTDSQLMVERTDRTKLLSSTESVESRKQRADTKFYRELVSKPSGSN